MPLSFSLCLLVIGVALIWFCQTKPKKLLVGKLLVTLATLILIISSLPISSRQLTTTLEREYKPLHQIPTQLDYIVVLGGGHLSDPYLPLKERLSPASYFRLMQGITLLKVNPQATLLLSGFGGSDSMTIAELYAKVAQQQGISPQQIRLFSTAKDTAEEAALMAPVIKNHSSALVTSATHMPRAISLFNLQGAYPLPAPTYYLGKSPQQPQSFHEQLPQARDLHKTTVAWHEVVGNMWKKIRQHF